MDMDGALREYLLYAPQSARGAIALDGRYLTYEWRNAAGQTVVRYSVTKGRGHSFVPSDAPLLWDWYASWKRDADGHSTPIAQ